MNNIIFDLLDVFGFNISFKSKKVIITDSNTHEELKNLSNIKSLNKSINTNKTELSISIDQKNENTSFYLTFSDNRRIIYRNNVKEFLLLYKGDYQDDDSNYYSINYFKNQLILSTKNETIYEDNPIYKIFCAWNSNNEYRYILGDSFSAYPRINNRSPETIVDNIDVLIKGINDYLENNIKDKSLKEITELFMPVIDYIINDPNMPYIKKAELKKTYSN